jgi:hypothetical protein
MHEQAMIEDTTDTPDRWSVSAYVTTALGLSGIGAAIIFLAMGYTDLASLIALVSCGVVLLPPVPANAYGRQYGRPGAPNDHGSPDDQKATLFGLSMVFTFLATCYFVKIWPLAHDADVVFSQSELRTALWITLSMIQVLPRAYRIWHTAPPEEEA